MNIIRNNYLLCSERKIIISFELKTTSNEQLKELYLGQIVNYLLSCLCLLENLNTGSKPGPDANPPSFGLGVINSCIVYRQVRTIPIL